MNVMPTQPNQTITPMIASRILNIHPATLTAWAESGRIPFMRTPGGHRRYQLADVNLLAAKIEDAKRGVLS
jgi:excisionase family DNA binding protein